MPTTKLQVNIFLGGGVNLLQGDGAFLGYRKLVIDSVIDRINKITTDAINFV